MTGLRLAGFNAEATGDAADARSLAGQMPRPDVVLLDASLWNADARQLVEDIRTLSPQCRFLILAVAGQEVAPPQWDGVTVIRKPFDLHAVVRLVQGALGIQGPREFVTGGIADAPALRAASSR